VRFPKQWIVRLQSALFAFWREIIFTGLGTGEGNGGGYGESGSWREGEGTAHDYVRPTGIDLNFLSDLSGGGCYNVLLVSMTEDAAQLRRFVENGDEAAFGKLVSSHFNLVYGTALRVVNYDASLAEDVAQTVFTDLARKAKLLPRNLILAGWLHEAARFAAAKAVRGEQRRRNREQEALAMQNLATDSSADWERLRPILDAALGRLPAKDRDAVLLHYFEQKNFRAVGDALGLSDDAAQKRVSRALDKLRNFLTRGGVAVSAASLANLLHAGTVSVAPGGLAASVAKVSLGNAAAMGPPGFVAGLLQSLAFAKARLAAGLLVLLLGGGAAYWVYAEHPVSSGTFITVDLSAHYNGSLEKSWTSAYDNNSLSALGEGRRVLKQVPFDIHGVVQLQGNEWKQRGYNYPERVEGIAVGTSARRIHILHANSAFADPAGTTVARLVLHYADGEQTQFDIRQGVEVLDWWDWPRAPQRKPTGTDTVVAWTGSNPAAENQGARLHLFDTTFVNPHPEKVIQTIDYDSAMAGSAPFMVALTVEL
jgi:RNA polymerase sigma factor (sigma-70 family)